MRSIATPSADGVEADEAPEGWLRLIEGGEAADDTDMPPLAIRSLDGPPKSQLQAETRVLHAHAMRHYASRLGRASQRMLSDVFARELSWARGNFDPAHGAFEGFARQVVGAAWRGFAVLMGGKRLWRERRDESAREAAADGTAALLTYIKHWNGRLRRLNIAHPGRWRVPGLARDELADVLEVKLLEGVRDPSRFDRCERPGMEATYIYLMAEKNRLRKNRRVFEVVGADHPHLLEAPGPNPKQALAEAERAYLISRSIEAPPGRLTRLQQQWLWRFRGDVFRNGDLNEARVAAAHGRNRSSAGRAKDAIRVALKSLGADELICP